MKSEGLQGFYRGYLACKNYCFFVGNSDFKQFHLVRCKDACAYVPASAVQWGSYELFKGMLFRTFTILETSKIISTDGTPIRFKENIVNGISGGLAAICAISANNPIEVLRIRTQVADSKNKKDLDIIKGGYWRLASSIVEKEGWRGNTNPYFVIFCVSLTCLFYWVGNK